MAFSFNWENRVDGQDYVMADDVNNLALGINELGDYTDTELGKKVKTADIVNDLVTGGATVPASAETVKSLNNNKVEKADGQGLSDNNFTNEYKAQLDDLNDDLADKVNTADIVDNLTTGGSAVPLSANMGVTLQRDKADQPYQQHTQTDGSWSVTDSAGGLVKEASILGNTIQNGTPTPEAPIMPVHLASGTEIPIIGKNFVHLSDVTPNLTNAVISIANNNEITVTNNQPVDGVSRLSNVYFYIGKLSPDVTYVLSAIVARLSGDNAVLGYPRAAIYKTATSTFSGATSVGNFQTNSLNQYLAFNVTTEQSHAWLFLYSQSINTTTQQSGSAKFINIQIESTASAPTPYEPYTNPTTLTVPCDLWKVVEAVDIWEPLIGVVSVARSNVVFNGTNLTWVHNSTLTNTVSFRCSSALTNSAQVSRNKIICNKFLSLYDDTTDTEHIRNSISTNSAYIILYIAKSRLTNWSDAWTDAEKVSALNTWFAANNVTVWYELATPIETQYPPQPITLPQGVVNVVVESSNGVLPSEVDMLYRQDLQAFVKSIADSIYDTLATNITDLQTRVAALENA